MIYPRTYRGQFSNTLSVDAIPVEQRVRIDINDTEDKEGGADMPVAYMPNLKKITLLQLDGELTPDQFNTCLDEAIRGCTKVYEIQRSSLMEKYFGDEKGLKE